MEPRRVRVRLDLSSIAAHLSRDEGRAVTQDEVIRWLKDAEFNPVDGWWHTNELDLGQVDPSEVLEIEFLDPQ